MFATATTARNITADGSVSFTANADGSSIVTSKASAKGADKTKEMDDGNMTADEQIAKQKKTADAKSGKMNEVGESASDGDGGSVDRRFPQAPP